MKKLDAFRCFVEVVNGELCRCNLLPDGGPDMWAGMLNWAPVRPPVDEAFLKAANEALGTKFTAESFQSGKSQRSR